MKYDYKKNLESIKNNINVYGRKLKGSGFFDIFGSSTVNQIVGFAYGILIVRLVPKSNYGVFLYANTIIQFFQLLSGLGINSGVLQMASEKSDNNIKRDQFISFGLRFGFLADLLLSLSIFIVSITYKFPIEGANELLQMMTLLPLLKFVKEFQKTALRVEFKNREYAQINTVDTILISVTAIIGALLFEEKGVIIGQYLASIITIYILYKTNKLPKTGKSLVLSVNEKKDLLKISFISMINNGLSQVLYLVGTFVLGLVFSDENAIATYKVASTIPNALIFIPGALMTYAYPYFARNKDNRDWVNKHYKIIMGFSVILNAIITAGCILLAGPIMNIVFGPNYSDATNSFKILMVGYFIAGTIRIIPGNLLVTQRKLTFNMVNAIAGGALSVLCNFFFVPTLGIEGAAIAHLVTMLITGFSASVYFIFVIRRIAH